MDGVGQGRRAPQTEIVQTAAWRAAFEAQATAAALRRVARFAQRRARTVALFGGRSDAAYAAELVQDALADTLMGHVTWVPTRCALVQHLIAVVRSRSRHEAARAARFPHEVFDDAAPAHGGTAAAPWAQLMVQQLAVAAAADDGEVGWLVAAYAAGQSRRDVLAAGWSPQRYAAARKRLQRHTARWLAAD